MADGMRGDARETGTDEEFYSISDEQAQIDYVQVRRAAQWVPFLLPHLRSGMRALDVGCGVGSITLDLAEIIAPGEIIGIDRDETQLAIARASAAQRGLPHTRFEVGSVYELPFPDATFDVALAHTLLFHLSDQLSALQELRRVLKPGGLVAISDDHYGTWVFSPSDGLARRMVTEFIPQVTIASGGRPYYSADLRHLLLEAGFARTEGIALAPEHYGTLAETRRIATIAGRMLRNPEFTGVILSEGLASAEEIEAIRDDMLAWGERPDAFAAVMYCAALGWVDPAS